MFASWTLICAKKQLKKRWRVSLSFTGSTSSEENCHLIDNPFSNFCVRKLANQRQGDRYNTNNKKFTFLAWKKVCMYIFTSYNIHTLQTQLEIHQNELSLKVEKPKSWMFCIGIFDLHYITFVLSWHSPFSFFSNATKTHNIFLNCMSVKYNMFC